MCLNNEKLMERPNWSGFGLKMFSGGLRGWLYGPEAGSSLLGPAYEEDQWYEVDANSLGFSVFTPGISAESLETRGVYAGYDCGGIFGCGSLRLPGDTVRRVEWRGLRRVGQWGNIQAIVVSAIRILPEDWSQCEKR